MALVLVGDAGIGKSTLWRAGIAAARSRGHVVLASHPTQAEQGLAYVVLGDLFGEVANRVLPALPPPRRRALEQALLIRDAPDDPSDPRTLGVAIHTALELLARDAPLLLAIDDVQWVDSSSVEAIGFATDVHIGVYCLIFYVVYQQFENYVIYPRVMSRSTNLPGSVIVIAALVGASLLGVIGALLAIPTAAAITLLVKEVLLPRQEAR